MDTDNSQKKKNINYWVFCLFSFFKFQMRKEGGSKIEEDMFVDPKTV